MQTRVLKGYLKLEESIQICLYHDISTNQGFLQLLLMKGKYNGDLVKGCFALYLVWP